MDLGITIKNLRKQRGQTQMEFAIACKITQTYLSQIENNQKEPNLSVLGKISNQLNIPIPVLFFLSLNEDDIPENKIQTYLVMGPAIKSFINELFTI